MTKVAIWCRHTNDNIIGIGPNIPWHVSSDFKRFKRITNGHHLVAGQTTYESFPNRTLPNRKLHVLTFDKAYQVSDPENHFVHSDYHDFDTFENDLFIVGGASIYKLFMADTNTMPDVIIDSEYLPDLSSEFSGTPVDITPCINAMHTYYKCVGTPQELDNIITTVWVKKDIQTPDILEHIFNAIHQQ
jgi:dihydrofolate reductase